MKYEDEYHIVFENSLVFHKISGKYVDKTLSEVLAHREYNRKNNRRAHDKLRKRVKVTR